MNTYKPPLPKWRREETHPEVGKESTMPLSAVSFMVPLPAEQVTPETERQIKEWLENYRPVQQRTVRSETTKDKAGALPPAVYQMAPQAAIAGQSLDVDGKADGASDDHYPNERDAEDEAQVHNGANTANNNNNNNNNNNGLY